MSSVARPRAYHEPDRRRAGHSGAALAQIPLLAGHFWAIFGANPLLAGHFGAIFGPLQLRAPKSGKSGPILPLLKFAITEGHFVPSDRDFRPGPLFGPNILPKRAFWAIWGPYMAQIPLLVGAQGTSIAPSVQVRFVAQTASRRRCASACIPRMWMSLRKPRRISSAGPEISAKFMAWTARRGGEASS